MVPLKTMSGRFSPSTADGADQFDALPVWQAKVQDDQVDRRGVAAQESQQFSAGARTPARWPAVSMAVRNRSRTNSVSSATTTVFTTMSAGDGHPHRVSEALVFQR